MLNSKDAFIVSACRSAIGTFLGGLSGFTATQLGGMAIKEAVSRSGVDPDKIDEVIQGAPLLIFEVFDIYGHNLSGKATVFIEDEWAMRLKQMDELVDRLLPCGGHSFGEIL